MEEKRKTITNLIDWLHQEATLRSRGKKERESEGSSGYKERGARRTDQHVNDVNLNDDESCPLGCTSKHLLASCPVYQGLTVNEKWEVVRHHKKMPKMLEGVSSHEGLQES